MDIDLIPSHKELKEIADIWGTPIFVYIPEILERNYDTIITEMGHENIDPLIAYSYKTNYLPELCSDLKKKGAGAEIVCEPEMELAQHLSVDYNKLVINGVIKNESMLKCAAVGQCFICNLETEEEALGIKKYLPKNDNYKVPVGVRLNLDIYPFGGKKNKNWLFSAKKFGRDIYSGDALGFCKFLKKQEYLNLIGLHVHLGSHISSNVPYFKALDILEGFTKKLENHSIEISVIDIGGGYAAKGIKRVHKDFYDRFNYDERAEITEKIRAQKVGFDFKKLSRRLAEWQGSKFLGLPTFIIEPGRYLVADSMVYLMRIRGKKCQKNRIWLLVDGGINHLPTVGPNELHEIKLISKNKEHISSKGRKNYVIAGPVCHRSDIFNFDICFGVEPKVGDYIAIYSSGAYSLSMSTSFNSYKAPVVKYRKGERRLIWRRETFQDLYGLDYSGATNAR